MFLKIIYTYIIWNCLTNALQIPENIKKCHFGDNKCITNSTNHYLRIYGKGNPKLGLPSIDNLEVEDITLLNSPGPLSVSYKLKNQLLKGIENATIISMSGFEREPELSPMEVRLQIPSLVVQGNYELLGRGLIVYTNSSGTTKIDMQNVRIKAIVKRFVEYRNNKRYLNIYGLTPQLEMDRWILSADNLYKENTDLTVILNQVINKKWLEFWNEVESTILPVYSKTIAKLVAKLTSNIPYDDMFLVN